MTWRLRAAQLVRLRSSTAAGTRLGRRPQLCPAAPAPRSSRIRARGCALRARRRRCLRRFRAAEGRAEDDGMEEF